MKVFISWSGETSGALAEILRQWIPGVIQAVRPYYSPGDVAKGARWTNEIAKELEEARVGLICLTRENLEAPWLMFEAGALSKSLEKSRVCPILSGIEPTDLTGPLAQFQASKFQKNEVRRVIRTINLALEESALPNDVLDQVFDMWWSSLEEKVQKELEKRDTLEGEEVRSERDLLEEILQLTRLRASPYRGVSSVNPEAMNELLEVFERLVQEAQEGVILHSSVQSLNRMGEPLRACANRRVAYVSRNDTKAVQSL